MSLGKRNRLSRIINRNTGKTVIVPMDHGMSLGPIPGLESLRNAKDYVAKGGANAVIMHKGLADKCDRPEGPNMGFIVHASASTDLSSDPNRKALVCTVEEALQLAADGISFHLNIGNGHDAQVEEDLAGLVRSGRSWGMPVLVMVYPRGENINEDKKFSVDYVKHVARVAAELGADIIKCSYTGSIESFREVVGGCGGVPVVIAGGAKMDNDFDLLTMVSDAIAAGAAGTSIGRNIFQHKDPTAITRAIAAIVHENKTVDEAMQFLNCERSGHVW